MRGHCWGVGSGGGWPSTQAGPGDLARCVFGLEFDLGMIKKKGLSQAISRMVPFVCQPKILKARQRGRGVPGGGWEQGRQA